MRPHIPGSLPEPALRIPSVQARPSHRPHFSRHSKISRHKGRSSSNSSPDCCWSMPPLNADCALCCRTSYDTRCTRSEVPLLLHSDALSVPDMFRIVHPPLPRKTQNRKSHSSSTKINFSMSIPLSAGYHTSRPSLPDPHTRSASHGERSPAPPRPRPRSGPPGPPRSCRPAS